MALMLVEGGERKEDMPSLHCVIEDIPAIDTKAKDVLDRLYIGSSGAFDGPSSLHSDFLTIQDFCRTYGLGVPIQAECIFLLLAGDLTRLENILRKCRD